MQDIAILNTLNKDNEPTKVYHIRRQITLGSTICCDVHVPNVRPAAEICRIARDNETEIFRLFRMTDDVSISVNGDEFDKENGLVLKHNDIIAIGDRKYRFELSSHRRCSDDMYATPQRRYSVDSPGSLFSERRRRLNAPSSCALSTDRTFNVNNSRDRNVNEISTSGIVINPKRYSFADSPLKYCLNKQINKWSEGCSSSNRRGALPISENSLNCSFSEKDGKSHFSNYAVEVRNETYGLSEEEADDSAEYVTAIGTSYQSISTNDPSKRTFQVQFSPITDTCESIVNTFPLPSSVNVVKANNINGGESTSNNQNDEECAISSVSNWNDAECFDERDALRINEIRRIVEVQRERDEGQLRQLCPEEQSSTLKSSNSTGDKNVTENDVGEMNLVLSDSDESDKDDVVTVEQKNAVEKSLDEAIHAFPPIFQECLDRARLSCENKLERYVMQTKTGMLRIFNEIKKSFNQSKTSTSCDLQLRPSGSGEYLPYRKSSCMSNERFQLSLAKTVAEFSLNQSDKVTDADRDFLANNNYILHSLFPDDASDSLGVISDDKAVKPPSGAPSASTSTPLKDIHTDECMRRRLLLSKSSRDLVVCECALEKPRAVNSNGMPTCEISNIAHDSKCNDRAAENPPVPASLSQEIANTLIALPSQHVCGHSALSKKTWCLVPLEHINDAFFQSIVIDSERQMSLVSTSRPTGTCGGSNMSFNKRRRGSAVKVIHRMAINKSRLAEGRARKVHSITRKQAVTHAKTQSIKGNSKSSRRPPKQMAKSSRNARSDPNANTVRSTSAGSRRERLAATVAAGKPSAKTNTRTKRALNPKRAPKSSTSKSVAGKKKVTSARKQERTTKVQRVKEAKVSLAPSKRKLNSRAKATDSKNEKIKRPVVSNKQKLNNRPKDDKANKNKLKDQNEKMGEKSVKAERRLVQRRQRSGQLDSKIRAPTQGAKRKRKAAKANPLPTEQRAPKRLRSSAKVTEENAERRTRRKLN